LHAARQPVALRLDELVALLQQSLWTSAKKYFLVGGGAKNSQSESSVLKTLAYLKKNMCNVLRSKYGLCSYDCTDAIKRAVFENISAALVL